MAHFTAILVYTWPKENKDRLYNYAFVYIYPYFHQNWILFTPAPKQNFIIYVKYNTSKNNVDWKDIYYEINSHHQNNRLAGNEAIVNSFFNAIRFYVSSSPKTSELITKNTDVNFLILKKIITRYLSYEEKERVQNIKIIIGVKEIGASPYYHYYKK